MSATSIPLDLYADHVINADKTPVDRAALEGKTIGLYFSAHWCGPCRKFTPQLAEKYNSIVEAGHALEIVFVSSDEDEDEALSYFASMPWKMLSFDRRDLDSTLSGQLGVRGIPTLVLLDKDGNVITDQGREALMNTDFTNIAAFAAEKKAAEEKLQKQVAELAASPAAVLDFLSSKKIFNKQGEAVAAEDIKGKQVIGVYFSAHWCPPCRSFTPLLAEKYKSFLADNKSFEIVFVSSDRDSSSADEYFAEMPWTMLDFADRESKGILSEVFGVQGIPTLVLLNDKEILTDDGTQAIVEVETFEKLLSYAADKKAELEKELAEFDSFPETVTVPQHEHPLVKTRNVYGGCGFGCDLCGGGGCGGVYHCDECRFDAHIKCALQASTAANNE